MSLTGIEIHEKGLYKVREGKSSAGEMPQLRSLENRDRKEMCQLGFCCQAICCHVLKLLWLLSSGNGSIKTHSWTGFYFPNTGAFYLLGSQAIALILDYTLFLSLNTCFGQCNWIHLNWIHLFLLLSEKSTPTVTGSVLICWVKLSIMWLGHASRMKKSGSYEQNKSKKKNCCVRSCSKSRFFISSATASELGLLMVVDITSTLNLQHSTVQQETKGCSWHAMLGLGEL